MTRIIPLLLTSLLLACGPAGNPAGAPSAAPSTSMPFAFAERSLASLQSDLAGGSINSQELVRQFLARIEQIDQRGPTLRSVLAINPDALNAARAADQARAEGKSLGPLHGIPVLLKDNIETADSMPTTAGSLALRDNFALQDAPIVARLRAAGAIILGKTNLSEWANFRSTHSISGWSGVGGLTRNPYQLDRSACGSSSGSGVAVAANLAAAAIGTETDGSVTCPAAINGLVGIKPTLGLLSRRGIVPIAHSQDTAGPMTRSVADAALLLGIMAGSDPADAATAEADQHIEDYVAALDKDSLRGRRIGVMHFLMGYHPQLDALFRTRLDDFRRAGAELIDIDAFDTLDAIDEHEFKVLLTEFKADLDAYLANTPAGVATRSVNELIEFNEAHAEREMVFFGQELLTMAVASGTLDDPEYLEALAESKRLAGTEGIDRLLAEFRLDALIAPTTSPAWVIDVIDGDHYLGSATTLAAVSGYPHVTVPMGQLQGLPVGLSLIGARWSDAQLLSFAYAFEQLSQARAVPHFLNTVAEIPAAATGMEPLTP